jgi:hypothetical protein
MSRDRLPNRRQGITEILTYRKDEEGEKQFSVTFNWAEGGQVREVFALVFKVGTDLQGMLHQACIITSVALQSGSTMADLARVLGETDRTRRPASIMGLIVRAGVTIDEQRGFQHQPQEEKTACSLT